MSIGEWVDSEEERSGPVSGVVPLAAVLVTALAVGTLILGALPRPVRQGALAVRALCGHTEIVLVGSSHVYTDVDPRQMERPWMNLAGGMLNYELAESVLATHVPKLSNLRAIVLEADALLRTVDSLHAYGADYRPLLDLAPELSTLQVGWAARWPLWKEQLLAYDLPLRVFDRDKLDAQSLHAALLGRAEPDVRAGYEPRIGMSPEGLSGAQRVVMHLRALGPEPSETRVRNDAALARIVALAEARELPLILVRLPHHRSYRAQRPAEHEAAFDALLQQVRAAQGGREPLFVDYEAMPLGDDAFYDADHLNTRGASLFSAQLARDIAAILASGRVATASSSAAHTLASP